MTWVLNFRDHFWWLQVPVKGIMAMWGKFFSCWMVKTQENWGNLPYLLKPQLGWNIYCHFSHIHSTGKKLYLPSKRHCTIPQSRVQMCYSIIMIGQRVEENYKPTQVQFWVFNCIDCLNFLIYQVICKKWSIFLNWYIKVICLLQNNCIKYTCDRAGFKK